MQDLENSNYELLSLSKFCFGYSVLIRKKAIAIFVYLEKAYFLQKCKLAGLILVLETIAIAFVEAKNNFDS